MSKEIIRPDLSQRPAIFSNGCADGVYNKYVFHGLKYTMFISIHVDSLPVKNVLLHHERSDSAKYTSCKP